MPHIVSVTPSDLPLQSAKITCFSIFRSLIKVPLFSWTTESITHYYENFNGQPFTEGLCTEGQLRQIHQGFPPPSPREMAPTPRVWDQPTPPAERGPATALPHPDPTSPTHPGQFCCQSQPGLDLKNTLLKWVLSSGIAHSQLLWRYTHTTEVSTLAEARNLFFTARSVTQGNTSQAT